MQTEMLKEIEALKKTRDTLQSRISTLDAKLSDAKHKSNVIGRRAIVTAGVVAAEIDRRQNIEDGLRADLEAMSAEMSVVVSTLDSTRLLLETEKSLRNQAEAKVATLESRVQDLLQQLMESQAAALALENDLAACQQELEATCEALEEALTEKDAIQAEKMALWNQMIEITAERDSLVSSLAVMTENLQVFNQFFFFVE